MNGLTRRATHPTTLRKLLAVLVLGGCVLHVNAQVGPAPGGPGGPGPGAGGPGARGAAQQATPPGPAAPVPAVVQMPRPTDAEVAAIKSFLAKGKTGKLLKKYPDLVQVKPPLPMSANTAIMPSLQSGFAQKHQDNLAVARQGDAELLFMGDSITDFWRNADGNYAGKAVQEQYFGKWKVANYGIAGDTTQGVLYRLGDGEGKGIKPRAIMLMIGTNNTGRNSAGEIAEGVGAIVLELQKDFPDARILLLGIFPRGNPGDAARATIADINKTIKKLDDGKKVFYQDIGAGFLDANGVIAKDIMSDALHPTAKGYEIWARAVIEPITAMMNGRAPAGR